jgi:hypothetical protein
MPRHPLASKIFSHEDQLFSHAEKIILVPMQHFYQQAMVSKATGNQTMLGSEPPTRCHHSNHGGKRDIVLKRLPCSKNRNNHVFSLPGYAGVKLLAHAGWVLPTWKEGYGQVKGSSLLKSNFVTYTFLRYNSPRTTKPAYDLSFWQKQNLN